MLNFNLCLNRGRPSDFWIRAGEWDTQTENEPLPHQDRQVALIVSHPGYKTMSLPNDYALLIVDRPFKMADNVETVCIPNTSQSYDPKNCYASGWGKDKFGKKKINEICNIFHLNLNFGLLKAVEHF